MNRRFGGAALLLMLMTLLAGLVASCSSPQGGFNPGATPAPSSGFTPGNGALPANVASVGNTVAPNPGGGIPAGAPRIAPPPNTYQGCPSVGDGGDPGLNIRKNRVDSAPWYPVSIASLLKLTWPKGIEGKQHANWSAADAAAIAQYDGIPVQIEGWLAGAKQEGPESTNCHAADDVDNHLWVVDGPAKDRSQSIVVEITPRVRAQHPGWSFSRVRPLVDGQTKVRISGWLMMDQEHPDQVGKTRGTIWEIHPIIGFDIQRDGQWYALDTGKISTTQTAPGGAEIVPTEDPNLPPAIVETPEPGARPAATPRPTAVGGGAVEGNGPIVISQIRFNGDINPTEPDEYVELHNITNADVTMDGWVLRDVYGGQEFTWRNFTLQAGKRIRVYTNERNPESGGFSFNSGSAIWRNAGDAAELQDSSGAIVATFAYGDKK